MMMVSIPLRDTSPHQDSAGTAPSGTPPPTQPPPPPQTWEHKQVRLFEQFNTMQYLVPSTEGRIALEFGSEYGERNS